MNSQTINKAKIQFKCDECNVEFCDEDVLKKHKLSNHEPGHFECHECGDKFIDLETLKRHDGTDHKMSRTYQCHRCDTTFPQNISLENHIKEVHSSK